MKRILPVLLSLLCVFPLSAAVEVETAGGLSYNRTADTRPKLFFDASASFSDWTVYLDYKALNTVSGGVEFHHDSALFSHQADFFSRYVFPDGGFSGLSYCLILNLHAGAAFFNLGGGIQGALEYSPYSNCALFILSPQFTLRAGYSGGSVTAFIFLENNYRAEREWNAKTSLGLNLSYSLSAASSVILAVSVTSCEVLMDPYRILYSSRIRMGYRSVL